MKIIDPAIQSSLSVVLCNTLQHEIYSLPATGNTEACF